MDKKIQAAFDYMAKQDLDLHTILAITRVDVDHVLPHARLTLRDRGGKIFSILYVRAMDLDSTRINACKFGVEVGTQIIEYGEHENTIRSMI